MNYAVEQRLRFIDCMLHYYGWVSRREMCDFFGIGGATATRDFKMYLADAPGNAVLNTSTKSYVKSETFSRIYE